MNHHQIFYIKLPPVVFLLIIIVNYCVVDQSQAVHGRYRNGIEFYFESNQNDRDQCDPLTPTHKKLTICDSKDVTNIEDLIGSNSNFTSTHIASYSFKGMWALYSQPNFKGKVTLISLSLPDQPRCHVNLGSGWNPATMNPRSLRFMANSDPELAGLSLYPGDKSQSSFHLPYGIETFLDTSSSDLGGSFEPVFWATSGRFNWTLYSEKDFEGMAVCVGPDRQKPFSLFAWGSVKFPQGLFNSYVRSAKIGCHSETLIFFAKDNALQNPAQNSTLNFNDHVTRLSIPIPIATWSLHNCTGPGIVMDPPVVVTVETVQTIELNKSANQMESVMPVYFLAIIFTKFCN